MMNMSITKYISS